MAEQANFKRINFFEGFFTTDEDWNAAEAYHLEKRRLHNRVLHTPGVVPVEAGGLKLSARGRGDLSFEVAPGYGIDGRGNELVLRDPAVKVIEADKLKLPQTVYVAIKYFEEPTDFIAYKENPRFKGHRRIEEKVKIEVMAREPDGVEAIELGRVRLEEGVREIRDALDPRVPGPGTRGSMASRISRTPSSSRTRPSSMASTPSGSRAITSIFTFSSMRR